MLVYILNKFNQFFEIFFFSGILFLINLRNYDYKLIQRKIRFN